MLSILQEACDWLNAYMARWYYVDFHGQHRKRDLSFWLPDHELSVRIGPVRGPDFAGPVRGSEFFTSFQFVEKNFHPDSDFSDQNPYQNPDHVPIFRFLVRPSMLLILNTWWPRSMMRHFWEIFEKELNVFSKLFWLFLELSDSFMVMQLNLCRFVNSSLYCQGYSDPHGRRTPPYL